MPQVQKKTTVSLTLVSSSAGESSGNPQSQSTLSVNPRQTQSSPCFTHSGTSSGAAPVFSKSLQDVTSPTSQLVVLECRIQGSPPLSVQWYRQGTLLKDSADFRILRKKACLTIMPEDVCTLVITEAFPEDSGVYRCVATNQTGSSWCSGQLTVYTENQDTQKSEAFHPGRHADLPLSSANGKGRETGTQSSTNANAPRSSEHSQPTTHRQGLVCPDNTVTSPSQRPEVSHKLCLDLLRLNASDLNREANSQRQDPPPPEPQATGSVRQPSPDQPPVDQRSAAMNVLNLPSRPLHQPNFNYERPSHFLQPQAKCPSKYQSVSAAAPFPQRSPTTQTLSPPYRLQPLHLSSQHPPPSQAGQWPPSPSTLSSPASTRSSSLGSPPGELSPPLTPQSSHSSQSPFITPPPAQTFSPFFTQSPAAFLSSILPSQPVSSSLPVNHAGLPVTDTTQNPRIVGKKVVKSPKLTSDREIQGSKDAVIQDLERKLRCKNGLLNNGQQRLTYEEKMARRLLGAENVASVFDLQQTESDGSQPQNSDSQRRQDPQSQATRQRHCSRGNENESIQEQLFPPRFLQKPDSNVVIQEYGFCRIDTKVGGLPAPELTWYLNGQPVCQDFTHKMLVSGKGVHSLIIDAVTSHDAGLYECVASNRAGDSRFTVQLDIEAREARRPAEFIYKLQNSKAVEGGEVRLECLVSGSPQPNIFWRKDHEMIKSNTDRIRMIQSSEGRIGLQIFPVHRCDGGWYTVSAQNEAGTSICTARLDIHDRPIAQVPNNRQPKVQPTFKQYFTDQRNARQTASYPGLLESDEL